MRDLTPLFHPAVSPRCFTPLFRDSAVSLIDDIHRSSDEPELLELLQAYAHAMGATANVFLVKRPEDDHQLTLQVPLACDPEIIYQHAQASAA
jgi:hypothetical protein